MLISARQGTAAGGSWVLSEQTQQDPCVVGNSRKSYYGKDWVLVKAVEPTSVASG